MLGLKRCFLFGGEAKTFGFSIGGELGETETFGFFGGGFFLGEAETFGFLGC